MNKLMSKLKLSSFKRKRLYLFLLLIFIIGVVFGSIFITILDEPDKKTVLTQIVDFFNQLKNNKIDYLGTLKNSITSNMLYILFIWLLGISIIGIPIIVVMVFLKGFMLGFSLASIIAQYKFVGVLGGLTYIFPHIIISIIAILIMSYFALKLSFNLFRAVIEKKMINFSEIINRYSLVLVGTTIIMVIASLFEAFVSPFVVKLFLLFLK